MTAFVVGYLSHLAADAVDAWFVPVESLAFLFWPILGYHHMSVSELVSLFNLTPYNLLQGLLMLLAVVVWIRDGTPGVNTHRFERVLQSLIEKTM